MKRKLFPTVIALLSVLFMASCQSEDPFSSSNNSSSDVNTWIKDSIFEPNYLWNVNSSPNMSVAPEALFNSLKNPQDSVSSIIQTPASPTTSYDIGFTYAANYYNVDKKTYYVIYYIHTNAPEGVKRDLKRGYIITHVNDTEINGNNASTLLDHAIQTGTNVKLTYIIPPSSTVRTIEIAPTVTTNQNPIFTYNILTRGSHRIGYLLYNQFLAGSNEKNATTEEKYKYDDELAQQFTNFQTANIDYFILDLRYNSGGSISSSAVLASAMVQARDTTNNFIIYVRSRTTGGNDLKPIKFLNKTGGGVSIPKLGDKLKGIYIITGKYTAGASLAFINAMQAYTAIPVTVVGEKADIEKGNFPTIATGVGQKHGYTINLALAYMANKDGKYNYASGISIAEDNIIRDVSTSTTDLLYPLGDESENILYGVLNKIAGLKSISATNQNMPSSIIYSPLSKTPWYNKSTINLDDLNK